MGEYQSSTYFPLAEEDVVVGHACGSVVDSGEGFSSCGFHIEGALLLF